MKKKAVFLFIPLFFAFSYLHEYKLPHFSFSTPRNASDASSNDYDIYSSHGDGSSWRNAFLARNNVQDPGAENNSTDTPAAMGQSRTDAQTQTTDTSVTPGLPNTGVEGPSPSSYAPPVSPTGSVSFNMPATTIAVPTGPSASGTGLTIFPQSSSPAPTTIDQISTSQSNSPLPPPPPADTSAASSSVPAESTSTTPSPVNATSASSSTSAATTTQMTPPPPPPFQTPPSKTPSTSSLSVATSTGITQTGSRPPENSGGNTGGENIFSTGGVTFRFDDGWQSQYDVALPALQAAGFKGTFYIVTRQLLDQDFPGFMSSDEVRQLAADGEDIGDHTQTHPHLPTLSVSQQQAEIVGARSDLESLGIHPLTVSYPYGEYKPETVQIVKDAGFQGAVTTVETTVSPNSDPYQLESPSLQVSNSPSQIEQMIQDAMRNHRWLIMTFHQIDTSGNQYSITPQDFRTVVDYVSRNHIPVVTVAQGLSQLSK